MKQEKGYPGNHIGAILELQAVGFQGGNDVDSLTFHAGVHSVLVPAGLVVENRAAVTDGAGLCG